MVFFCFDLRLRFLMVEKFSLAAVDSALNQQSTRICRKTMRQSDRESCNQDEFQQLSLSSNTVMGSSLVP
jgi:hypothetical protein